MTPGMPLAMACAGERVRIVMLAGGRGMHQRLASMGLNVGSEIEVIKKGIPGPFLVSAGDTRLAVGAGIAHKIMVSPIAQGTQ
ncbi:MAG: ferrous iron transport protein A [Deltaproteobacteria bacterium]|nr:ferrous iron transport protein A [Deltaproteobacteria bacterium]MBW2019771.1 ferrous iron transport protein A [Deltaproteobacteria bacterium]MBW2074651.1 ferrous iron transport protein A [Deltaproteobacteria bacterium]RLB83518.1 MAG: ferrous iron transport protein A [Deltaproteobacteria bacterium]